MNKIPQKILIIIFNLVPIAGVLFYNWSVFEMFWLFWMETLVIAFFNFIRVVLSQGNNEATPYRYGPLQFNFKRGFTYLIARIFIFFFYSIFIVVFIGFVAQKEDTSHVLLTLAFQNKLFNIALLLFACGQVYYLVKYFFMSGGYFYSKAASYPGIFDGRQIVMHIAIVLGAVGSGFLLKDNANPVYASGFIIIIFCALKLGFELYFMKTEAVENGVTATN